MLHLFRRSARPIPRAWNVQPSCRPWLLLVGLLAAILAGPSPGSTQELQRIAAVVNDEVISIYDLATRVRLVMASSNLEDTPDNRRRLAPQILRALIDERLQLQEAKRLNIAVADSEVTDAMRQIERSNNMPQGGLDQWLKRFDLPQEAIASQIRAGIGWQRVIARRVRPQIQIGADEVDEVLARVNASEGRTELLLGEIFLAVDSPEQDEEVKQTAMGLIQQMRNGAPFSAVARQFSQSASAAAGGDTGWVQTGQLEEEIEKILVQLQPNQVTIPLRSVSGYYIYLLRDRRTITARGGAPASLSLMQVLMPIERGTPDAQVASQIELAKTVQEVVKGCPDFVRVAKEMGLPEPAELNDLKPADIAENVRTVVTGLKVGEVSRPIRADPGILLVMVCKRSEPSGQDAGNRDEIADGLLRQRLDLLARKYLRDLRRTAFVDVRV